MGAVGTEVALDTGPSAICRVCEALITKKSEPLRVEFPTPHFAAAAPLGVGKRCTHVEFGTYSILAGTRLAEFSRPRSVAHTPIVLPCAAVLTRDKHGIQTIRDISTPIYRYHAKNNQKKSCGAVRKKLHKSSPHFLEDSE